MKGSDVQSRLIVSNPKDQGGLRIVRKRGRHRRRRMYLVVEGDRVLYRNPHRGRAAAYFRGWNSTTAEILIAKEFAILDHAMAGVS